MLDPSKWWIYTSVLNLLGSTKDVLACSPVAAAKGVMDMVLQWTTHSGASLIAAAK